MCDIQQREITAAATTQLADYPRQDFGVRNYWSSVNHIAIVVSNVGRSLGFYANVIGMKQVLRPDFYRHGAWLTFGNVDLHLIKGRPAVHPDDHLLVSHIAINVDDDKMDELQIRLLQLKTQFRSGISVPDPSMASDTVVTQLFVRDPDGYYIEFCTCASLREHLNSRMSASFRNELGLTITAILKIRMILKRKANAAKMMIRKYEEEYQQMSLCPDWMNGECWDRDGVYKDRRACPKKLANLMRRRQTYGDIMQNVNSEEDLKRLLIKHANKVPEAIEELQLWVRRKGSCTLIPPKFYDKNGKFTQPKSFEMTLSSNRHNGTQVQI